MNWDWIFKNFDNLLIFLILAVSFLAPLFKRAVQQKQKTDRAKPKSRPAPKPRIREIDPASGVETWASMKRELETQLQQFVKPKKILVEPTPEPIPEQFGQVGQQAEKQIAAEVQDVTTDVETGVSQLAVFEDNIPDSVPSSEGVEVTEQTGVKPQGVNQEALLWAIVLGSSFERPAALRDPNEGGPLGLSGI